VNVRDLQVRTVLMAPSVLIDQLNDDKAALATVRTLILGVRSGRISPSSRLLDLTVGEATDELSASVRKQHRAEVARLPTIWPPSPARLH
jgi:hypothetical protein